MNNTELDNAILTISPEAKSEDLLSLLIRLKAYMERGRELRSGERSRQGRAHGQTRIRVTPITKPPRRFH